MKPNLFSLPPAQSDTLVNWISEHSLQLKENYFNRTEENESLALLKDLTKNLMKNLDGEDKVPRRCCSCGSNMIQDWSEVTTTLGQLAESLLSGLSLFELRACQIVPALVQFLTKNDGMAKSFLCGLMVRKWPEKDTTLSG